MVEYVYPENNKYIYPNGKYGYSIIKCYQRKGGKRITKYFGFFTDYNECIKHRDKCIEANWDESMKHLKKNDPLRNISKKGNKFEIHYNGKYYGVYWNVVDAMNERDLLEENDWDEEQVWEL